MSGFKPTVAYRLVAAAICLLVLLGLIETVVRLAGVDTYFQNRTFVLNRALDYPDVFMKDADLFWQLRPNQTITSRFFEGKTYHINALGLRGREVSETTSGCRIMALGNSCTFGWGVSLEETYTAQLETMLTDRCEVINAGVPGYTSLQGRRLFQRRLVGLQPDIVLILFAWNDHWAAAGQISDKQQQFPPPAILTVQNVLSRFHSYRLMKKLLLNTIERHPDSTWDRSQPVYRVGLTDFADNLAAICRSVHQVGATPVLLTSPIPSLVSYYPPGSRSPMHDFHERYNRTIRGVAAADGIELVDLAHDFDEHNDLFDDAKRDPTHFNARGHRLAAQSIAQHLYDCCLSAKDTL
ncbi:MAG: SGNH/GDSL hydrolase family protein [bacterium]